MTIRLGILGVTGMAGREALLHQAWLSQRNEVYAAITCVTGGPASVGKRLGDVIREKESLLSQRFPFWQPMVCPGEFEDITVEPSEPSVVAEKADYVLSALPASAARNIEPALRKLGVHVFSNAAAFRQDPDVPLLIPEVNPDAILHLEPHEGYGVQVCNPNCVVAGFAPVIRAIDSQENPLELVIVSTQQSLSGKGDAIVDDAYVRRILGGIVDDWTTNGVNGEEEKICREPRKILAWDQPEARNKTIHARTARVATQYGHLLQITAQFRYPTNCDTSRERLSSFTSSAEVSGLPSTPKRLFELCDGMPDLRHDIYRGNGMTITVGDLRQYAPNVVSMQALVHNLRRGATWASRQGLELFLAYHQRQ